jgi:hypothetical protein
VISWSRVLLEKLTAAQLDKKFLAFYGTRKFLTAFTEVPFFFPIRSQLSPTYALSRH